jgi:hypothetical protein
MKTFLIALSALAMIPAASAELLKQTVLANKHDFVIYSDVEASKIEIFLSYTGTQFNHCGIALRNHGWGGPAEKIHEKVAIDFGRPVDPAAAKDVGKVEDGRIVARLPEGPATYGAFYEIRTRSGQSLKSALQSLSASHQIEALVEILTCDR